MVEAICAGIVIGLGCVANLYIGGIMGAIFYAIVVMSVIYYDLDLFVGHTGILNSKQTDIIELGLIFMWNIMGVSIIAVLVLLTPSYRDGVIESARKIWEYYNRIGPFGMVPLGIFCGLTMYGGIVAYTKTQNYIMTMIPIMMCILCNWPFSLNIIFLLWFNQGQGQGVGVVGGWELALSTLIGNLIGCNAWLLIRRGSKRMTTNLEPQKKTFWDYFKKDN